MPSLRGIALDTDDLYWTNDEEGTRIGALHKAFSEPFVKAVPLFNYQVAGFEGLKCVDAGRYNLYFLGTPAKNTSRLLNSDDNDHRDL
jgi:hypothetical protein